MSRLVFGGMSASSFLSEEDVRLSDRFLSDGFVIQPCEYQDLLDQIRGIIQSEANRWLSEHGVVRSIDVLSDSHLAIPLQDINEIRLHLYARLNSDAEIRKRYFSLAGLLLQKLVGNELAMQNKVNLSIQQPHDQTSVLELHSDVWSGDSPFQVVLWVPLTDSNGTNAMFLLPPEKSHEAYRRARAGELRSMSEIHDAYRSDFRTVEVKFGQVLVFNSNCLHGNQLNTTSVSRWSLNCRVVSLLAPATTPERRLGAYYTPIMVRPATRMGLQAIEALGVVS